MEQENVQEQVQQENVQVTENTGMEVEVVPEDTTTTTTVEAPEEQSPEPTGQDVDDNVQQRVDAQTQANEDLKNDLEAKGVNWDDLDKTYTEKGELTAEQLQSLEKAGYPKSVVDAYIRGMEAEYDRLARHVVESAGGQEEFIKLQTFASQQNAEYKKMWNDTMNSGNVMAIQTMLRGIRSDMVQTMGSSNPTIVGGSGAVSTNVGFNSKQEMVTAMADPRYGKDKAYTREIEQKVISSKLF